jgi:hypothetical protein
MIHLDIINVVFKTVARSQASLVLTFTALGACLKSVPYVLKTRQHFLNPRGIFIPMYVDHLIDGMSRSKVKWDKLREPTEPNRYSKE